VLGVIGGRDRQEFEAFFAASGKGRSADQLVHLLLTGER
jgi:hypothetical protein